MLLVTSKQTCLDLSLRSQKAKETTTPRGRGHQAENGEKPFWRHGGGGTQLLFHRFMTEYNMKVILLIWVNPIRNL